ncbi:hypothetical protein [Maridesulfovibrio hydrothermalis]|uniref:Lipoprotein n=1 Tax=Maridesulfovibrio hydrothermalis AM13 = DSM 14728 TaxID=1121451 RepID=L0REF5_9BACT|nr:hypothetical protein [Maridesulfovibrio hydrothermalis]CCO25183.1 conserved exported protein of unknown function [Maridesulfovibrio hydrothermalis AM13 = DSM 14728]
MKKIKIIILCMAVMLALAACGFKHADSAKSSMHNVNQSAQDLKNETQVSKQKTEEIKEQEAQDSTEDYKW